MTNRLAAATLSLEAFVAFFATLVALKASNLGAGLVWGGGLAFTALFIVAAGLVRKPGGLVFGWILQAALIATGFIVPSMFIMGGLFAAVWAWLVWVGRKIDRERAAYERFASQTDTVGSTSDDSH